MFHTAILPSSHQMHLHHTTVLGVVQPVVPLSIISVNTVTNKTPRLSECVSLPCPTNRTSFTLGIQISSKLSHSHTYTHTHLFFLIIFQLMKAASITWISAPLVPSPFHLATGCEVCLLDAARAVLPTRAMLHCCVISFRLQMASWPNPVPSHRHQRIVLC